MTLRGALERLFLLVEPLVTAAVYLALRLTGRRRSGIPILMYHQIGRPVPGVRTTQECVSPGRFARQMAALTAAGYRTVSLADLARALRETPHRLPPRAVVITFDDGLVGQFTEAFPVLQRHELSATFFLIAGHVGAAGASQHLGFERPAPEGWQPFGWQEARVLAERGMLIGSHTISHRSLGALDAAEARTEIHRSREILRSRIGVPVTVFAYPFGSAAYHDVTAATREQVARAGYVAACTTRVGTNRPGADPLALRRLPVDEADGAFRIRCKLAGAYDWVGWVKDRWQRTVPRKAHHRVDVGAPAAEDTAAMRPARPA